MSACLSVLNNTTAVVNATTANLLSAPLSGLMGLAFQSIAASGATPFWQALAETSGALDSPLFAFQLNRFNNNSNADTLEAGGTFTLGATNTSLYSGNIDFQSTPAGAPGYWILELASKRISEGAAENDCYSPLRTSLGLKVNGQSVTIPTGQGAWSAIDTGTTGVGLPQSVLTSLFANIQGSSQLSSGYYQYRKHHGLRAHK